MGHGDSRARRQYDRAVRRAFARVTFYRDQCATAGRLLAAPVPTPLAALPQPPHTLCPFARPWSPGREPSLWTPTLLPLSRALVLAGCRGRWPVLEVRESLLDHQRLPRFAWWPWPPRRPAYRVLLSATAVVASEAHRAAVNRHACTVADRSGGLVVGAPAELTELVGTDLARLRPVHRLRVADFVHMAPGQETDPDAAPAVLYEPMLGYLGARVLGCGAFHIDRPRVYARTRGQVVSFSLPGSRRPTLLDIVPPGADLVTLGRCPRHGAPVLLPAGGQPSTDNLASTCSRNGRAPVSR